jgi:hypothetical protein
MRLLYGWVIVAVGIVVGCIGTGGVMPLGVFLQPMADSLGWSHAGISTALTLAFLWTGIGGFLWGWLYDRYGARVVVLVGGFLQGIGLVAASQAQSLPVFLAVYDTSAQAIVTRLKAASVHRQGWRSNEVAAKIAATAENPDPKPYTPTPGTLDPRPVIAPSSRSSTPRSRKTGTSSLPAGIVSVSR